ncbi:gephyrin-like molybdotransferase Glp [Stappia sp.]|jgi:molybdopterin molybdotransferase|uniref:molybdopterin molybdotransferase MoeA n=1 Tax=Stappia sp. TaxID=1870903 RepID=UPI003A9921A2
MAGSRKLKDDCFLHDRDRLRHAEALEILEARLTGVTGCERVPLGSGCGRVLAETVSAPRDVPADDNSAVDGYAFAHASYLACNGRLKIAARIAAGHPANAPLPPGTAARIFTGAVMPQGADTVAMQEDCAIEETGGAAVVAVPDGLKPGANRRRAGEDLRAGAPLLDAGTRLRPQDLAAIASTGQAEIDVFRRLRVALVSSGDEIRRPGEPLPPGGVYDANHFLLKALVEGTGATATDLGVLPDKPDVVHEALAQAARTHDLVLTSGGASRGEEDHMVAALDALGSRHMWQLAIKPGRPMSFGQIGDCVVLGLPGNPVAAMVCFLLYARPVISALSGAGFAHPHRFQVPAAFGVPRKKADRREFYRGTLASDPAGRTVVDKFARDGSGLISGLRAADGLIEIPEATTEIRPGDLVDFLPFPELGLLPR